MISYVEGVLQTRLSRLDHDKQSVFAAACAERLYPLYEAYCREMNLGQHVDLRAALDSLWNDIVVGEKSGVALDELADFCETLIPREEVGWTRNSAFADDAAASAAYALRTRSTGSVQQAAWAARRAYEAADYFIHNRDRIGFNQEGAEAKILTAPEVQIELEHQEQDLRDLEGSLNAINVMTELGTRIRERAVRNAVSYAL